MSAERLGTLLKRHYGHVTVAVLALILLCVVARQVTRVHGAEPSITNPSELKAPPAAEKPSQESDAERKSSEREFSLRGQLQDDPHDKAAYEELRELVEERHSGSRSLLQIVETWAAHNQADWETMLHIDTTAALGLDDPEEAIRQERLYLSRTPRRNDPDTWDFVETWIAKNLMARDHSAEALSHLKHQAVLANRSGDWSELADAELRLGDTALAITSYRRAVSLEPGNYDAHLGLAKAFFALRDYQDSDTEAHAALSLCARKEDDDPDDPAHLRTEGNDVVLSNLHQSVAKIYFAEGDFEKAISEEEAAQKSESDSVEAGMTEAMLYSRMGAPAKSKAIIDSLRQRVIQMLSQEKDNKTIYQFTSRPENLLLLGGVDDDHGDMASTAIWYLEPQLKAGSLKAAEEMALGKDFCTTGRIDECEKTEMLAMRADPQFHTARAEHDLARALLKGKEAAAAREHFRSAYELDPENLTYRLDYEVSQGNRTSRASGK